MSPVNSTLSEVFPPVPPNRFSIKIGDETDRRFNPGCDRHPAHAVAFADQVANDPASLTLLEWYEIHRDALRFGRGYITLEDVEAAFNRAKDLGEFKRTEHWRCLATVKGHSIGAGRNLPLSRQ